MCWLISLIQSSCTIFWCREIRPVDKARVINVPTLYSRLLISLITVYIIILGQRYENTYLRPKRRKTYTPQNPTNEHMYVGGHNNFFLLRYSLTYGRVGGGMVIYHEVPIFVNPPPRSRRGGGYRNAPSSVRPSVCHSGLTLSCPLHISWTLWTILIKLHSNVSLSKTVCRAQSPAT